MFVGIKNDVKVNSIWLLGNKYFVTITTFASKEVLFHVALSV